VNPKKKQLMISLGVGFVCAVLGTVLISRYTGGMTAQFSSVANDLQKKYTEKTKAAEALTKELDRLKLAQQKWQRQQQVMGFTPTPQAKDPTKRYLTLHVDDTMGWNTQLIENDRVDVACSAREQEKNKTRIILKGVRVAGLTGERTGGPADNGPVSKGVATLELAPSQASLLVNAMGSCKLYFIESSSAQASYPPYADLKPDVVAQAKPVKPKGTPKLSLYQLPLPAPMALPSPQAEPAQIEQVALIKGGSQEVLEFTR
jgi:hypothetical protein